jgi:hypothetical protein
VSSASPGRRFLGAWSGRDGLREIASTLAQLGLSVDDLTDSSDALRFDPDAASAP